MNKPMKLQLTVLNKEKNSICCNYVDSFSRFNVLEVLIFKMVNFHVANYYCMVVAEKKVGSLARCDWLLNGL